MASSSSKQLVFLDESGDVGAKIGRGASPLFIVALTFIDKDEAEQCNRAIDELRARLRKPDNFEFHFTKNSDRIRLEFLKTVKSFDYQIVAVSLDKDKAMNDPTINTKTPDDLYFLTANIAVALSGFFIKENATIVVDKTGSKDFLIGLRKSISLAVNSANGRQHLKFKAQDSRKNNLLQLADYSVAVIARKQMKKPNWLTFYKLIKNKIRVVEEWPK
jgi:hypothetical protein